MITPTTGRVGDVDVDALGSYTEFLVEGGVHGLFPCGSIGEFSSLTREQRHTVIETVVDAADDRPVIAGCGGTSVGGVVRNIDDASEAGADAAVVVTPYYLNTTQDGMREFYETVADRSTLPILLYNIPHLTGHSIAPETVAALAEDGTFIGIKDSSGNFGYHYRLLETTPDSFTVIQGISGLAVTSLDSGGDGMISGPANVFPTILSDIYDSYRAGNRERAVRLMNEVTNPIVSVFGSMPTASALKHLVGLAGHDVGPPLLPLPELTDEQQTTLTQRYEAVVDSVQVEPSR